MPGPFPIFCRGHSGGRILSEAYMRAGISMGNVSPGRNDTVSFAVTRNAALREVAMNAFRYPLAPESERRRLQDVFMSFARRFQVEEVPPDKVWGWKMGTTIFTILVTLDSFPESRVVHLIRDGRDVMLSRLDARFDFSDPVNRVMTFGDTSTRKFMGMPLESAVHQLRNELEMQHWVTAVEYGLRAREYANRYLEVHYESLCKQPIAECRRIFAFLDRGLPSAVEKWLSESVRSDRVGKWRTLDPEALRRPLEIGGNLLRLLGYA